MSNQSFAATEKAQLTLGDKISIFSDKAYRKNEGRYFEAVGNVVIISQKDTIYGELASLDQTTSTVKIEGNVRIISQDMTLYGSHLEYNIVTGVATIKNARIVTSQFNLVASQLIRLSETEYVANEAEFSTCKDCPESWSVYGKVIKIKTGSHVQVSHGLFKVKGVNVIYLPYLILPIQTQRKTGLLFPEFSSRVSEGLAFEQPIFVAIDESKDMTISPTFWATRGYGADLEYRQRFNELSWMELDSRVVNDTIYEPGKSSQTPSGEKFFRYFVDAETHQQWSSNLNTHMRYTGTRDLDFVRDYPLFTDPRITGSDFGFKGHSEWRQNYFNLGVEAQYLRNELFSNPMEFDRLYVQTLPRVTFSTVPFTVVQTTTPGLENITMGLGSSYSRFRQVDEDESVFLRNADRVSAQPYVNWHLFTKGPTSLKTRYVFDQQYYMFEDHRESKAGKNASLFTTEFTFSMDKIFGLAYEEKIPVKYIPEKNLKKLRENKEQGLSPLRAEEKEKRLIGELDPYESELARENIIQTRNSYRHSQEFKFIHHYISSQSEYGNKRFLAQIRETPREGIFDYEDTIRSREYLSGSIVMKSVMPLLNTMEFQWNNSLTRKTPRIFNYFEDDKYLRDNFTYSRIGYFNVSQGYMVDQVVKEDKNKPLTRLLITAGYSANRWSFNLSEAFFHYDNENIFSTNATKHFDYLNVFGSYSLSSFQGASLETLRFGGQVRPTDILGLAMVKELDLEANKNVRTVYSLDIMPHNDCWILSFNYRESLVDQRFFFNIMFNFGDQKFSNLKNDYFAAKRL